MTTAEIVKLIIAGLMAGALSGLVGVGGGIIIVPALIFLMGYTQKMAQGTSLFLLLLPFGLMGVLNYYKQGYVNIQVGIIMGIGFFVGAFLGSKFALYLPEDIVKKVFAAMLIVVGVKLLLGK